MLCAFPFNVLPLNSSAATVHDFSPSANIVSGADAISDHINHLQVSVLFYLQLLRAISLTLTLISLLLQSSRQRQLLANVHGHTHAARGLRVLGRCVGARFPTGLLSSNSRYFVFAASALLW